MDRQGSRRVYAEAAARRKFYARARRNGETSKQYSQALRELVIRCNFGDMTDVHFKARFFCEFPEENGLQITMPLAPENNDAEPQPDGKPKDGKTKISYEKTPGAATGAGEDYEWKMLTLIFLRLLPEGHEFQLASNMKAAEKFDDIIMKHRKDCNEDWNVSYVQLKHKQKQNQSKFIANKEFLGLSGDFSLIKYCESYEAMKLSDELRSFGDFDKHKIYIFTNMGISDDLVEPVETDPLLNTGGTVVSFKKDGEIFHELCDWVLMKKTLTTLKGQVVGLSAEEVKNKILDALKDVIPTCKSVTSFKGELINTPTSLKLEDGVKKLNIVKDKDTYSSFLAKLRVYTNQANTSQLDAKIAEEFAKVWKWRCNPEAKAMLHALRDEVKSWWQNDKFYLTKDSILWLDLVKSQIDSLSARTILSSTWTNAKFEEKSLQALDKTFPNNGIVNVQVNSRTTASSLKVRQALALSRPNKIVLHVNVETLLDREDDVLSAWSSQWCQIMVIECDRQMTQSQAKQIAAKILKVLGKENNGKLLVLIAPEKYEFINQPASKTHIDNCKWSDMTEDTRKSLIQSEVNLQGTQMTLSNLVDDNRCSKQADQEFISQLLSEETLCGKPLDTVGEIYVKRRMKTLRHGELFPVNSVHDFYGKVVLLVAEPGMGKSTLITHLARSAKEETPMAWIVHLKLNDCAQYLESLDPKKINEDAVKKFIERFSLVPGNSLEKVLFQSLLHKLIVFIDGVDEVSPSYEDQILSLLKFLKESKLAKLVVTSRPVFESKLEGILGVKAYHLAHFSKEDQTEFFNKKWKEKLSQASSKKRPKATRSLLARTLGEDNPILGVPLFASMVADKFEEQVLSVIEGRGNFEINKRLNTMELYKGFVTKKFDRLCNEKKKVQNRHLAPIKEEEETLMNQVYDNHRLAALQVLFSPKDIDYLKFKDGVNFQEDLNIFLETVTNGKDKMGIIDNVIEGRPHFVHHSFAEYFAATWLALNFEANLDFIKKIIFDPSYKLLSEIFHYSLAVENPLHIAVLNRDLKTVEQLLSKKSHHCDVNERDKGGRTPLHLAVALSGTDQNSDYIPIVETLVRTYNARVDIADTVLGWVVLQYAEQARAWKALQIFLKKVKKSTKAWPTRDPEPSVMLDAAQDASATVVGYLAYDLKCQGSQGDTMVHRAAEGGRVDMLKYLHDKKMSLDIKDNKNNTALHYSTYHDKAQAAQYLLEQKSDWEAVNSRGLTALEVAAQNGAYEVMAVLFERGATYKSIDHIVNQPRMTQTQLIKSSLLCAAFAGDMESVKLLVELRADFHSHRNDKGHTAAWVAMHRGHRRVLDWLLLWRAKDEDTPLHGACRMGEAEIVSFLISCLEKGDSLECRNKDGKTPLHVASMLGRKEVVELLLNHGASVDAEDDKGWTPLHCASWRGQIHVMELLLNEKANVEWRDMDRRTPLHKAASWGRKLAVELLLRRDAKVGAKSNKGWTPLHDAARSNKVDVVMFLSEIPGASRLTPLMTAAVGGDKNAVVKVLKEDWDASSCNKMDKQGWTAIHFASAFGRVDVISVLIKEGCNILTHDCAKMTPLHLAALCKHPGALQVLLEAFPQTDRRDVVNACDTNEDSVLNSAVQGGSLECVKLVVEAGGKLSHAGLDGKTPLMTAASICSQTVVQYLLDSFDADVECISKLDYIDMVDNDDRTVLDVADSGCRKVVESCRETLGNQ